ncbi:MAG: InlB B-repeat-containing protein [Clostridiales bacterium]|nr:InlB B-repeat-containing protein [Clostridiales bacterium]
MFTLAAAPVWEGYTFLGWHDGTETYGAEEEYTMPDYAVTFTAIWEKVTYAITYDLGSCGDTAYAGESTLPTEEAKAEGATLTLAAAPVWEGYAFLGWSDGVETYGAGAEYTMPDHAVTLTATWEKVYAVRYNLGSCGDTPYAGQSTFPNEEEKAEGETHTISAAPVWTGYTFLGWSDGTDIYSAGAEYTMPDHAVTFTALWGDYPEGYVKDENVTVGAWAEGVKTVNYEIFKGEFVRFELSFSGKNSGKDQGIIGQAFANSDYNKGGTFLQFRPDFAIDRSNWSWTEDNTGFTVTDTNWDEATYSSVSEGDLKITFAISESGVFSYTVVFTSESYSFTREFVAEKTMNSALAYIGYVGCAPSEATVIHPEWTAPADPEVPDGYRLEKNVYVGIWDDAVDTEGYEIVKGQQVQFVSYFNGKSTAGSEWQGVVGQVFANGNESNTGTFYYFRPDFAIKRNNWSWNQGSDLLPVESDDWNTNSYIAVSRGTVAITVALSEEGILTYKVEFTSENYSYTKTYTAREVMNSALVYFGSDGVAARPASVVLVRTTQVTLDYDYDIDDDVTFVKNGNTYTFGDNPYRTGYLFLGWQLNGEGEYYKNGDTYTVGADDVTFIAAWVENAIITIDRDGGTGNAYRPKSTYNAETGKFDIEGLPSYSQPSKEGYAFKGWEVIIGDVTTTVGDVNGVFSVNPGTTVVFKAIWGAPLTVTYDRGESEGTPYGGSSKLPTVRDQAEGGVFTLAKALEWDGHIFLGWSDGTATYDAEAKYTMPDHAITLTAVWEKLPHYSVTFLPGSCDGVEYAGQGLIDERDDMYEGAVFPLAREIKWDGYTFLGWNDGENTYPAIYRYTMPAHAVVFTAVWEKVPTPGVTYLPGTTDEVLNMPTDTTYYAGQKLRTIPMRFGYTFMGWSDGTTVCRPGEVPNWEEGVTVTAQWEAVEDTRLIVLTGMWEFFDGEDMIYFPFSGMEAAWDAFDAFGSYIAGTFEVTQITDTQIKFTMLLTRGSTGTTRYSGTYYYSSDVIQLTYGFGVKTLTRSTEKPTAISYALGESDGTAYAGTSTCPNGTAGAAGTAITLPEAPVWDGYTFLGWSDGEQTYSAGAEYTLPEENVTLTATWEVSA